MGKTCEPKAFSFQCMTKFTTNKKLKKKKVLHCLAVSASVIGETIRKINVFILVGKMLLIFRTSSDGRGQKEAHVRVV